jgi:hypothetical protein
LLTHRAKKALQTESFSLTQELNSTIIFHSDSVSLKQLRLIPESQNNCDNIHIIQVKIQIFLFFLKKKRILNVTLDFSLAKNFIFSKIRGNIKENNCFIDGLLLGFSSPSQQLIVYYIDLFI